MSNFHAEIPITHYQGVRETTVDDRLHPTTRTTLTRGLPVSSNSFGVLLTPSGLHVSVFVHVIYVYVCLYVYVW